MPYKDPAAKKRWREENRDRNALKLKEWKSENPDRVRAHTDKYEQSIKERDAIPALVMKLFNDKIDTILSEREAAENVDERYRRKLRDNVISFLGGRCEFCGMDKRICLEIDHIEPVRRRTNGIKWHDAALFWRSILKGDEKNAQLLCANCHRIKTRLDREYGNGSVSEPFDPYAGLPV